MNSMKTPCISKIIVHNQKFEHRTLNAHHPTAQQNPYIKAWKQQQEMQTLQMTTAT